MNDLQLNTDTSRRCVVDTNTLPWVDSPSPLVHRRLLERIGKAPLLDLGMRLGEGSGAAVAVGIVRAAVACHTGMATFAEAAVSGKE